MAKNKNNWSDEDEAMYQKYLKQANDSQAEMYGDYYKDMATEPKWKTFEDVKHADDVDWAHQVFGGTFGRGGGAKYGKLKGLEGLETIGNVAGSAAIPVAQGTSKTTSKLPNINQEVWTERLGGEAEGENELRSVAGGEGQRYPTTKASLKTDGVSANEGIRLKGMFNNLRADMQKSMGENYDFDLSDFEGKKVEVPANNAKEQAKKNGAMLLTPGQKNRAAQKAGFDTTSGHQKAGQKMQEANKFKSYDVPKDAAKEEAKKYAEKWGTTINGGKSYDQRYEDTFKANHSEGKVLDSIENNFLPRVYQFMDYVDSVNPEVARNLRETLPMTKDAKISLNEKGQGALSENSKTMVREDLRDKGHQEVANKIRISNRPEKISEMLENTSKSLSKQFESMPDKSFYEYASKILGKTPATLKEMSKPTVAFALANLVAQLMYSEDMDKLFDTPTSDKKSAPLFADESHFGAMSNKEKFADPKIRRHAIKASDILLNDWLDKHNDKNIDAEDLEDYKKVAELMKSYNSSKGQAIRASDDVLEQIMSDPQLMRMFNKYNELNLR